jgi:hypothetical protein
MWQTAGVTHRRVQSCLCTAIVGFTLPIAQAHSQAAQRYQWPTLGQVLRENSAPVPAKVDAGIRITSFGVVNSTSQFVIAYYEDSGTNALKPPLHLLRYAKSTHRWYSRDLGEAEVKAPFMPSAQRGGSPNAIACLGSASVRAVGDMLLVGTHLTPSAECTTILRPDLSLVSAFSGWEVAAIGSVIVVERSEIHFAATHRLRLATIELATGIEHDLFPRPDDRLRNDFRRRLAAVEDYGWCLKHNASCDPQKMSTDLGNVAVNVQAKAVAFEVTFDAEGFGPKADSEIGSEKYFYVFELHPLRYREFDEFDMQPMFGAATPERLVQSENLKRIFAAK